ncbi:flagellin [Brevibacillus fulvus]|uniref:Flagellin n=1 Tax=Brevibacillus fulvus TaxID=1125967 RepID=A0A939BQE9_9BACL|nr:flagellin-like hook-associated protein FlgL [Brevibacillus fulvus]
MIISHNSAALYTFNRLRINNRMSANAMEKLSSGLRINKAADDAAGLAISEKMRAQIRGLEQASRNIQDGISLIQTAESALGSIHDSLQRMRELAVQAANDTLNASDRKLIQSEIEQIINGIDEIANHTNFNEIKLLNNKETNNVGAVVTVTSLGGGKSRVEINTPLGKTPEETADNLIQSFDAVKNGLIGDSESIRIASEFEILKQNASEVLIGNMAGKGYLVGTYNTLTNSM